MKKLIAIVLSVLMVLSFVACGQASDETTDAPETNAPETNAPEIDEPATNDNVILPTVAENTWGAAFWADFEAVVAANKGATADVLAGELYMSTSGSAIGMGMVVPMEAGYFQGFSADVNGFKTAAAVAPMMSSALMVYVFELDASANVREFVKTLNDNADPAWMICMTAETTTIGAIDNYVLVAYAPTVMPGGASSAAVIEAVVEEGTRAQAFWNEFISYMENFGGASLSEDVAYAIAYGSAIGNAEATVEALGEETVIEGFNWEIGGYTNGAVVKAGATSIYVFQLEFGMDPAAWGDWSLGMNVPEGTQSAWGAYGETLILMVGTEA